MRAMLRISGTAHCPRHQDGFTLLETMFVVTIAAVLLAVAAPSFEVMMAKRRVSSAAQAIMTTLRAAQAESMRRNRTIEWLSTNTPGQANTVSATPNWPGGSTGWMARVQNPTTTDDYVAGDERDHFGNLVASGNLRSIAYTPMGRMIDLSSGTAQIPSNLRWMLLTDAGTSESMCIYVQPGGGARVCSPGAPSGTTTACQPAVPAGECGL